MARVSCMRTDSDVRGPSVLRTVFQIPLEIGGWPLFGFGLLFWVWLAFCALLLAWLVRRQGWNADTQGYLPILAIVALAIVVVFPRIAQADGLAIRGYGTMLVLATFVACGLAVHRARQVGLDPDVIYSLAFWLFLGGIGGARLFYVIQYFDQFRGDSLAATAIKLLNFAEGGLVVYGSVIAATVAYVLFVWIRRQPALALLDVIAPSVAIAVGFGRVGCFLNGCCFGGTTDVPWAVSFPADSPPWEHQVLQSDLFLHGIKLDREADAAIVAAVEPGSPAEGAGMRGGDQIVAVGDREVRRWFEAHAALVAIYRAGAKVDVTVVGETVAGNPESRHWTLPVREWSRPIHPTQLYSSLNGFVLAFLLWTYYPFRRRDGEVIAVLMTLYPITPFHHRDHPHRRTVVRRYGPHDLAEYQSGGFDARRPALDRDPLPPGPLGLSPQSAAGLTEFQTQRTIRPPAEYR